MTVDFRALQTQVNKIITSGSTGRNALLLIYPYSATNGLNQGDINSTVFPATGIGTDVFVFVSGAIGGKGTINNSVFTIGGDLHVSGTIYTDSSFNGPGFADTINSTYTTTTGSTPKTIYTYTTSAEDQVIDLSLRGFGRQYSGPSGSIGQCTKFVIEALFERTGSTVTSIDENVISWYPSSSFDIQFNITGSDIEVQVVGGDGRNMDWRVISEFNILTSSA